MIIEGLMDAMKSVLIWSLEPGGANSETGLTLRSFIS